MKKFRLAIIFTLLLTFGLVSFANAAVVNKQDNNVQWLGHSATLITTEKGLDVFIDPWITDNPKCPVTKENINPDLILVTHNHFDHMGTDVPYFVEKNPNCIVVVHNDVVSALNEMGITEKNIVSYGMGLNYGGQAELEGIKITMVQAIHNPSAAGYIIELEDGTTIYHAGDTGIFAGMELLGNLYDIDLALLPTGSTFVMNPFQAAHSLKLLKPKKVIPIHYGTFEVLVQDATEFVKLSKKIAPNVKIEVLKPGGSLRL
ncbi:metal-dependent hydrolase [Sporotomaculum syntrophicum]|uniref:Metal-dependent hydrolase n=1 Tax=Sporotomaculum syntrophicum TaxID=182264 RepID=A0A9D2WQH4_9FIRM|nr:metal-dependent hydrolase [Sporotomaculum syntrophicum]KAF1085504.1 metal-dependent hydrolase [Sporotomaculum syntrophicum]